METRQPVHGKQAGFGESEVLMKETRESLLRQVEDVLEHLQTPCGGVRSKKECTGFCVSDGKFVACSDWKAPVREDGYSSKCYYVSKARRLLGKFRKLLKEENQ